MKEIKGFEGMYAVTKDGRVFGLPHQISNGKGIVQTKFRELKPNKLAKGYLQVTLYNRQTTECRNFKQSVIQFGRQFDCC